jgi:hypothetical protein
MQVTFFSLRCALKLFPGSDSSRVPSASGPVRNPAKKKVFFARGRFPGRLSAAANSRILLARLAFRRACKDQSPLPPNRLGDAEN